ATRNRGMPLEALRYDITPVGMHYLLIHFDVPLIDPDEWRLTISGVKHPVEMTYAEVRDLPRTTLPVTMECAGNGRARLSPRPLSTPWLNEAIGTAEWSGTSLWPILQRAGLPKNAAEIVFTGADPGFQGGIEQFYERSLTLEEAQRPEVLLAYEMNGRPLEPQHGFPLRLIVPGWYGMTSVKWLTSIRTVTQPFEGYQMVSYRYRATQADVGEPVKRMRPRALMIPPGIPDYFSRHRIVSAGPYLIRGRAWSGQAEITKVDVGVDGSWSEATLGEPVGPFAWRSWSFAWHPQSGEHELSCRATDSVGNVQPPEAPWNAGGFGNNSVQTVAVTVR
ncbi:MAG: sulfite oxidase, partial [Chloroflexota bacterium]